MTNKLIELPSPPLGKGEVRPAQKPPRVNMARRLLRALARWLGTDSYCGGCGAVAELIDDRLILYQEGWVIQGVRFWRCPACRDQWSRPYTHMLSSMDV